MPRIAKVWFIGTSQPPAPAPPLPLPLMSIDVDLDSSSTIYHLQQ